ncbi:unnamed protein product [Linum trigynum]|uniref:Uncharacterized protein n=1 Tax=Linum trigynum TaxID=586398 RepID=A0AAV2DD56_9ROSI
MVVKPLSLAGNGMEFLLRGVGDSSKRIDMMKFLRNVVLLRLVVKQPDEYVTETHVVIKEANNFVSGKQPTNYIQTYGHQGSK